MTIKINFEKNKKNCETTFYLFYYGNVGVIRVNVVVSGVILLLFGITIILENIYYLSGYGLVGATSQ